MSDLTSCKFCHDTLINPKDEKARRVSFIANPRLLCLRCHPNDLNSHPVGDHMKKPKWPVPAVFKLDARGRITCTTCHNPHIDRHRMGYRFVVDVGPSELCKRCHKGK